jgi:hypothetical protein
VIADQTTGQARQATPPDVGVQHRDDPLEMYKMGRQLSS